MDHRKKPFSRDAIKLMAMGTMLLNHCAHVFLEPGTLWFEICIDLGYFTAITMCYFLVEGMQYTHSKARYGLRLAVFAILSELPFCLAFTQDGVLQFCGMNMMFTLLLCFGVLMVRERVKDRLLQVVLIVWLVMVSQISDWGMLAPIFTLLFAWSGGSETKTRTAFLGCILLFAGYNLWERAGSVPLEENLVLTLGNLVGPALSGLVLRFGYHGRRTVHWPKAAQWFFYGFYPIHLLILGLLRLFGG